MRLAGQVPFGCSTKKEPLRLRRGSFASSREVAAQSGSAAGSKQYAFETLSPVSTCAAAPFGLPQM